MAEGQNHGDDEQLFAATEADESDSPSESTSEGTEKPESEGEETKEVKLDLEDKVDPAEESRQKQEDAWFRKISSGEKKLEDLPKHQQWLKKPLEERLNADKKKQEVTEEYDIDAIVSEKIREEKDRESFATLRDTLNSATLTAKQKADVEAEFKDLRTSGLPRTKALQKAIAYARIDLDSDTLALRRKMALPKASTQHTSPLRDESNPRVKHANDPKKRVQALNALAENAG